MHTKIILVVWLRYDRREDELIGVNAMDCCGRNLECPKVSLVSEYAPESIYDPCLCTRTPKGELDDNIFVRDEECSTSDEDEDMSFCVGNEKIRCVCYNIALLSGLFKTMLYGGFIESSREKINFTQNEFLVEALKTTEILVGEKC